MLQFDHAKHPLSEHLLSPCCHGLFGARVCRANRAHCDVREMQPDGPTPRTRCPLLGSVGHTDLARVTTIDKEDTTMSDYPDGSKSRPRGTHLS